MLAGTDASGRAALGRGRPCPQVPRCAWNSLPSVPGKDRCPGGHLRRTRQTVLYHPCHTFTGQQCSSIKVSPVPAVMAPEGWAGHRQVMTPAFVKAPGKPT